MIKILDCTTRDGGHNTNWEFDDEFVKNHIDTLNKSGVVYYEIGYRNHFETEGKGRFYNCTPDMLNEFYKIKGNLQIGVMTDTSRYSPSDFRGKEFDKLDFVRVATHPENIAKTLNIAKDLYTKGYKVFVQLMDITNIDADGYLTLFAWEDKDILESLYLADSYGILQTQEVSRYFNKLKILGYNRVSFHAHNNSGKALANTLEAIESGAYSVDVTKDGIGRCGGNLDCAELFYSMKNSL